MRALPRRVDHENYGSFGRIDVRPRGIKLQLNGNVAVVSLIPKNIFRYFTVAHGSATLFGGCSTSDGIAASVCIPAVEINGHFIEPFVALAKDVKCGQNVRTVKKRETT